MDDLSFLTGEPTAADPLAFLNPDPSLGDSVFHMKPVEPVWILDGEPGEPPAEEVIPAEEIDELTRAQAAAQEARDEADVLGQKLARMILMGEGHPGAILNELEHQLSVLKGEARINFIRKHKGERDRLLKKLKEFEDFERATDAKYDRFLELRDEAERLQKIRAAETAAKEMDAQRRAAAYQKMYGAD